MCAQSTSRRGFIKGAGLVGTASLLAGKSQLSGADKSAPSDCCVRRAKNIIFLVADGMGTGTLSFANYWQQHNEKHALNWLKLYEREDVVVGMQETASASSPVTDSAAAASAWGSGQRVNNRSINVSPDGKKLKPFYSYAKEAGKATGLVTSCRVTHATPAGFSTNVPHRDSEDDIAAQYLKNEIDVLLGGGDFFFKRDAMINESKPELSFEAKDLFPDFKAKGYGIAHDRSELQAAIKAKRMLGVFSESHVPYRIDRLNDPALREVPSLPEMMEAALSNLSRARDGFVLLVEGGRVDHAGHVNDAAAILHEQLEFDECIPQALKFMDSNPDTLVIVTTDHGTAGCQLNGWGANYNDSGAALERINGINSSFEALAETFAELGQFDAKHFKAATGIIASQEQLIKANAAIQAKAKYLGGVLADIFAEQLIELTAVGWTSHNHTSEHVPMLALGPGAEQIPPLFDNYQVFSYLMNAFGIQAT